MLRYVTTFIAQYFGANRPDRIGLALWQGIWIGLAAVPLFVLFVPFAPTLFSLAGHEPDVAKLETTYFQVVAFGGGAAVMAAALGSFFTGLGHARVVMLVNLVGSLLNVALNWILIFGHFGVPEMGIAARCIGNSHQRMGQGGDFWLGAESERICRSVFYSCWTSLGRRIVLAIDPVRRSQRFADVY
ncbi:MAG: MATE family efflux transporter [Pirellulaceae bacterium]